MANVPLTPLVGVNLYGSTAMVQWMNSVERRLAGAKYWTLFDHYADAGNTTTGETTLYTDTLDRGQLFTNGDKIVARYSVIYAANANTKRTRLYFGGTAILDTTALARNNAAAQDWIEAVIIRESATVVRCAVVCIAHNGSGTLVVNPATYTRVTGLTLGDAQIVKLTGQSSAATDDIVAKLGIVSYVPAAV